MASAFKALALPAEPLGLSSIKPSTPSHSKPISLSTSDNTNNSKSSSKTETDSSTKTVVSVNGVSKEEEDFPPLDVKNFVSYVQSVQKNYSELEQRVSISLLELTGQIKTLRETVHQLSTTKNPSSATLSPTTTTTNIATPPTTISSFPAFPTTATLPNNRMVGGSWGDSEVNTSKLLLLLNQNKEEPSFSTLKLLPDLFAHHAQFPFFPPGSNSITLPPITSASSRPEQPFSSLNKRTLPDGSQSLPSARRRLSSENFSDSSDEDQEDEGEEDEDEESRYQDGKKSKKKRKGRGKLPEGATKMLTKWLLDHATAPYPTQDEKDRLIAETGLSCVQINNWFGNARRRILPAFHRKVYTPQPAPTVVL